MRKGEATMTRIMKTMLMAVLVVVLGVSVVVSQTAPPQAGGKSAAPGAAVVAPKELVDLNSATVDQLKELVHPQIEPRRRPGPKKESEDEKGREGEHEDQDWIPGLLSDEHR